MRIVLSLFAIFIVGTSLALTPSTESRLQKELGRIQKTVQGRSEEDWNQILTTRDLKGNRTTIGRRGVDRKGHRPPDPQVSWATQDPEASEYQGTRTEKAYAELELKRSQKILVAVIDTGVDFRHPDLRKRTYKNWKEILNPFRTDFDHNDFVDDKRGWNFFGNKDGTDLVSGNLEIARELGRIRHLAEKRPLSAEEALYLEKLEILYEQVSLDAQGQLNQSEAELADYEATLDILKQVGLGAETMAELDKIQSSDPLVLQAKEIITGYLLSGVTSVELRKVVQEAKVPFETVFNTELDLSALIGDDPTRLDDKNYGNAHVNVTGTHGTHVAGIIAGRRNNGNNLNGQAEWVRILPVRILNQSDERDKDVANAIRYAVDQGAKIINMSFGKPLSPDKAYVDEAAQYAADHGVLLVHAAGNASQNNDEAPNFPSPTNLKGQRFSNWIEVGASTSEKENLVAKFSNFGKKTVDLFAPGKDIFSSLPDRNYSFLSGTSMAAPEVSGIAALVWSQAPHLTASQLREVLNKTTRKYKGLRVAIPFFEENPLFSDLSITGGVIDAYNALIEVGVSKKR